MDGAFRQAEIDRALPEAIERLRREFSPVAIYQFGSSVSGEAGRSSDLDLLVVLAESSEDFFRRGARAMRALRGLDVPIDVLVYTRSEFEVSAERRMTFEHGVKYDGRVLYAA